MRKLILTIVVALFATVVFGQTKKTIIKPPDLPKCVAEWVKQNMKDFSVDMAYKFEQKSGNTIYITYYVKVVKGKELQWLSVDRECKKVKKINEDEAKKDPPTPVPPVKKSTDAEQDKVKETK